jgi:indolepyruvate ferredoxin oxidoreductase, beta subunit
MSDEKVLNIVFAGIGGTGVIKASDVLAHAVFIEGYDVKKAEVHGMSQRGGSVRSEVRIGKAVFSPMPPEGEVDFLVIMEASQVENNRHLLAPEGRLLMPEKAAPETGRENLAIAQPGGKAHNVTLLGRLSVYLPLGGDAWMRAIDACFPEPLRPLNRGAFQLGAAHETFAHADSAAPYTPAL